MRIAILGAAAGGGFPQWNCNCRNCSGIRNGTLRAKSRTQSSIFIRNDRDADGILFNASPDILEQIRSSAILQPRRADRDTAIAGIVLMDGQIDHTTGLFMLRERGAPLAVWCTDPVEQDLQHGNPVFRVLSHFCGVQRERIPLDGTSFQIPGVASILLRAIPLQSKAAPYSPHREAPVDGDNIGLLITDTVRDKTLFYAPGLGEITKPVFDAMASADCVMVDGTFWTDDEMISLGMSKKTARSIGHLPQSGPGGMIETMARLPPHVRRMLIHINNTNPILDEDSAQHAELARAGIALCEDGTEIIL